MYIRNFTAPLCAMSALFLVACNSDSALPGSNSDGLGSDNDSETASRDWSVLDPQQTVASPLNDVFLVDGDTIFAVGDGDQLFSEGRLILNRYILRSLDGGITWTDFANDITQRPLKVHFVDEQNGWIVGGLQTGENPLLLRTTNGGTTWSEQSHPISGEGTFYDIQFVDTTHGWIAGGQNGPTIKDSERYVLVTTDGGDTWQELAPFSGGEPFKSISFVDQNYGWVVGEDEESADNHSYYFTTDGGTNWQTAKTGIYEVPGLFARRFDLVQFASQSVGYVARQSTVLRTTDGGNTWSVALQSNDVVINDMTFIDENTGWVVGNGTGSQGSTARILFTNDGGETWVNESIDGLAALSRPDTALNGVHAVNGNDVIAVGNRLTIVKRYSE